MEVLLGPARFIFKLLGLGNTTWLMSGIFSCLLLAMVFLTSMTLKILLLVMASYLALAFVVSTRREMMALEDYLSSADTIEHENILKQLGGSLAGLGASLLLLASKERRSNQSHRDLIEEISHSANELSASSDTVAKNITQQSKSTSNIAAAVTEISYSINDMSSRINSAHEISMENYRQAESGANAMHEVRSKMGQVAEYTENTNSLMASLEERTSKVSSISTVITGIAEQTNLLALNAAIEAARAGEYGRGFTVVAEEVRELANRSYASAQEINDNIREVQEYMQTVRGSMDKVVAHTEDTLGKAEETETILKEISQNANSVSQMVSEIRESSEQQNEAAREISANIESVSSVADENSHIASQASDVAYHLYKLCKEGGS